MKTLRSQSGINWVSFLLGVAVTVLVVTIAMQIENAWSDSVAWRVHHVPMLSTQSERAFVSAMDELKIFGNGIRKLQREILTY